MVTLSEMETRTPIVRWAQNGGRIDLTIELIDAKKPQIEWTETGLKFTGFGAGARGENLYQFSLKFYSKIDYQSCKQKVTDRSISLQAWKQVKTEEWPRLLKSQQKPAWLKIDFDKWKVEDSETEGENIPDINKISFEQRIKSEVEKAKDDIWIYAKMAWLTIYNLLQAICFSIIFTKILILFAKHGKAASLYVYDDISDLLLTCQLAAFVEILNPLFGIVKTGLVAPTMQVFGRNFVLFVLIVPVKGFHQNTVVTTLFFAWSAVEIIRYPFYLIALHRGQSVIISWLRYSAWVVLYPAGMICEVLVMYQSIYLPETEKRFSFPLPNIINFSFNLTWILKFCLCIYLPMSLYLLKHMWILRQRKLGGNGRTQTKTKQS